MSSSAEDVWALRLSLLVGSVGLLVWLLLRCRRRSSPRLKPAVPPDSQEDDRRLQQNAKPGRTMREREAGEMVDNKLGGDEPVEVAPVLGASGIAVGTRVEFIGLQKAPDLNGTYGVVYDSAAGRFAVRKEVSSAGEERTNLTVKASNIRPAAPLDSLAALQRLVDAAPQGARITLARGLIEATDGTTDGAARATLLLQKAITLTGMGCRNGGTVLGFGVIVGDEARGSLLELSGMHIRGAVDISPKDITRLRLCKLAVSAPRDVVALYIDEIAAKIPSSQAKEADGRVLLDECWIRGGSTGVRINAVGCVMKRSRVTGAGSFGVQSMAHISVEACTIGECAKDGPPGGGILARAGCTQLRGSNGMNMNRVQRDHADNNYSGYVDCRGCVGRCTCTAMYALPQLMGEGLVQWGRPGKGKWQNVGCL